MSIALLTFKKMSQRIVIVLLHRHGTQNNMIFNSIYFACCIKDFAILLIARNDIYRIRITTHIHRMF